MLQIKTEILDVSSSLYKLGRVLLHVVSTYTLPMHTSLTQELYIGDYDFIADEKIATEAGICSVLGSHKLFIDI